MNALSRKIGGKPLAGSSGIFGNNNAPQIFQADTADSQTQGLVLDLISEGPILGLADVVYGGNGAKSIYLNGTQLQRNDGGYNFNQSVDSGGAVHPSRMAWAFRNGTATQDWMRGFSSVESEVGVGITATHNDGHGGTLQPIITVSDPFMDAIVITVRIPQLSQEDANGNILQMSVSWRLEYQDLSFANPPWVAFDGANNNNTGNWTVSGKSSSGIDTQCYQLLRPSGYVGGGGPGAGTWNIRLTRLTGDFFNDPHFQCQTVWFSYTRVVEQKLTYTFSATVGLEAPSSAFGGQMPARHYDVFGRTVQVPINYTPTAYAQNGAITQSVYTGIWNGAYKIAWTDNPAWCVLDLLTNTRYGLGIPIAQIDVGSLYVISQYCDQLVSDGFGGLHPRYTLNIQITTQQEAYNIINQLCAAMVTMVYYTGGLVTFAQDSPRSVDMIVAKANVINGSFEYQGQTYENTPNVIIARYLNPAMNYQPDTVVEQNTSDIAKRSQAVPLSIDAFGVDDIGRAHRIARWALYTNIYETEVMTYQAGLDHADVMPGYIVQVADPVKTGTINIGGRVIASVPGSPFNVTLDRPVTLVAGHTYTLNMLLPDKTVESYSVVVIPGATSNLWVNGILGKNLLSSPSAFESFPWSLVNAAIVPNAITAPDGTLTAEKFNETALVSSAYVAVQSITKPAAVVSSFVLTVYAKAAERTRLVVYIPNGPSTSGLYFVADLAGVQVGVSPTTTGANFSGFASVVDVGNGWCRCTLTGITDADAGLNPQFHLDNGSGTAALSNTYTGTAGRGVYLWGANLSIIPGPSLLYSPNNFAVIWGGGGVNFTPNNAIAPDGTLTAQSLFENTTSTTDFFENQTISKPASALTYSYTWYLKSGVGRTRARVLMSDTNGGYYIVADLAGSQIGVGPIAFGSNPLTNGSASVVDVGNGWRKCTIRATTNAFSTIIVQVEIDAGIGTAAESATHTGVIGNGIFTCGGSYVQVTNNFIEDVSNAIWTLQDNAVTSLLWRVLSKRRVSRSTYEITATHRYPNKFDLIESNLVIDSQLYKNSTDPLLAPGGLSVREYLTLNQSGVVSPRLLVGWSVGGSSTSTVAGATPTDARITNYTVQMRQSGNNPDIGGTSNTNAWTTLGQTRSPSLDVIDLAPGTYDFQVRAETDFGLFSDWTILTNQTIASINLAPANVTNFVMLVVGDNATLTWDAVTSFNLDFYEIRFSPDLSGGANWNTAAVLQTGIKTQSIQVPNIAGTYFIKAINIAGVESITETKFISAVTGLTTINTLKTIADEPFWSGNKTRGLSVQGNNLVFTPSDFGVVISLTNPAVFTKIAHNIVAGTPVVLSTTATGLAPGGRTPLPGAGMAALAGSIFGGTSQTVGNLPSSFNPGQVYYVASSPAPTLDTFALALTPDGTAISALGLSQSGTQVVTVLGATYTAAPQPSGSLATGGITPIPGRGLQAIAGNFIGGSPQSGSIINLGGVFTCRVVPTLLASGQLLNNFMSTWVTLDSLPNLTGTSTDQWSAKQQIRFSDTNPDISPSWQSVAGWSRWFPGSVGDYKFWAIQEQLILAVANSNLDLVATNMDVAVTVPDRVIAKNNVAISAGANVITFAGGGIQPFFALDGIAITVQAPATGDSYILSSMSPIGFTIQLFASAALGGGTKAGTINYVAKGYGSS